MPMLLLQLLLSCTSPAGAAEQERASEEQHSPPKRLKTEERALPEVSILELLLEMQPELFVLMRSGSNPELVTCVLVMLHAKESRVTAAAYMHHAHCLLLASLLLTVFTILPMPTGIHHQHHC
jgi:hypothetical protein